MRALQDLINIILHIHFQRYSGMRFLSWSEQLGNPEFMYSYQTNYFNITKHKHRQRYANTNLPNQHTVNMDTVLANTILSIKLLDMTHICSAHITVFAACTPNS